MASVGMDEVEKNNECPICNRNFSTLAGLRQHITKNHTEDEINSIIAENTQRSQLSTQQPPPPRPYTSQLQIIKEDINSSIGKSLHQFDIIENDASGDCLFLAILEHLQRHKRFFPNAPKDAQTLRTTTVNHIVLPTDELDRSNFSRFKENILVNLNSNIRPSIVGTSGELLQTEYAKYMSSPGSYGTTAELCAAAEIFNFGFYVVRKDNDDDYTCYDYGSLEKLVNSGSDSVLFLLFTGSPKGGHFRLLVPDKSSPIPALPIGKYRRIVEYTTSRLTSICPVASIPNLADEPTVDNGTDRGAPSSEQLPTTNASNEQSQQEQADEARMKDMLVFIQTLRAHTTVLKRIPKAARIHTAVELSKLITSCTQPNAQFLTWAQLFTFSYIAFRSPDRKNKSTKELSLATIVKRNLDTWSKLKRLPFDEFTTNILSNLPRRRRSKTAKDAESIRIKLVQAKLSDGDISGAIRILSSNDSIAAVNNETFQKLLEKHPEPTVHISVDNEAPVEISPVSSSEVKKSIFGFATGSSGGMDGIKPQHLKDLVGKETGEHGEKVLESLSRFSDFCLGGNVPEYVTHFLYGAALCGLNKKDDSVRPIAIGNTLRRLVSRIASSRVAERTGNELRPKQLGYGTRGGCEAGVHAARHFVNSEYETVKVFIKLDYKNAYNEIERHPMLQATKEKCPEIFPFIHQCYANPSWLTFGDFGLLSQRGCQQGDPCGPAIFCLGIHDMVMSLISEFNIWYMDDGSLGGNPDTVLADLQTIIQKSAGMGLQLNFTKCELKILGTLSDEERIQVLGKFNQIAPGIIERTDDIELLGAPLTISGIRNAIQRKLMKLKTMVGRMDKLTAHHSYCLLRSSLTIPQLNYLLRTTPCWQALDMLEEYDNVLKSTMESIVNCRFSGGSWNEATLPIKLGGLGLRNATNLCYSSFLGSIHSVKELVSTIVPTFSLATDVHTGEALDAWSTIAQSDIVPESDRKFQHKWDSELCSKQQHRLSEQCETDFAKARIMANKSKESGAWLNTFPFSSLGTLLDNQSFRIAVSLRLGIPVCVPHTCVCGGEVDELGHHGLSCNKSAAQYARHAMVNDLFKRALITSKVPALLEPTGCTLAKTYVKGNARKPGFAAHTRENYKRTLYRDLEANFHFVPVCVETLGTFGESALKLVKRIGELMQNVTGEKRSTSFLIQRISVAVQRGNAAAILGTVPSDCNLEEIYYL